MEETKKKADGGSDTIAATARYSSRLRIGATDLSLACNTSESDAAIEAHLTIIVWLRSIKRSRKRALAVSTILSVVYTAATNILRLQHVQ